MVVPVATSAGARSRLAAAALAAAKEWELQDAQQRLEKQARVGCLSQLALEELTDDWRSLGVAGFEVRSHQHCVAAAVRQHACALLCHAEDMLRLDRDMVLTALRSAVGGGDVLLALHELLAELHAHLAAFSTDRELMLQAVTVNGDNLQYACEPLRADRQIALAAVASSGTALAYLPDHLRSDKDLVFTALKSQGELSPGDTAVFPFSGFCGDRAVVMEALKQHNFFIGLDGLSEELRHDAEVVMLTLMRAPHHTMRSIPPELWLRREILNWAVKSDHVTAASNAPAFGLNDRELALPLLSSPAGAAFIRLRATPELMSDHTMANAFWSCSHIHEFTLADKAVAVMVLGSDLVSATPVFRKKANIALMSDYDVAVAYCRNSYAPVLTLREKALALALLHSDEPEGVSLFRQKSSGELLEDFEVAAAFCRHKHSGDSALASVGSSLRDNKAFVIAVVRIKGKLLRCASDTLRDDQEVVLEALKSDKQALEFASQRLQEERKNLFKTAGIVVQTTQSNSSACATM